MFSVIIPLYNQERTIRRAVSSVLNQTCKEFEIIVVNDGSTDNGPQIIDSLSKGHSKIHLLHSRNEGVSAARNRGLRAAQYEYIAFLDGDDEWLPEFLDKMKKMIEKFPGCGFYACRYLFRGPEGKTWKAVINGLPEGHEGILDDYFAIASQSDPPVWTGAVCARKDALVEIDGFPTGVALGEDLLTWTRLATGYSLAYSMQCLSIYCLSASETFEAPPRRIPPDNDIVGRELKNLLHGVDRANRASFRQYCALWHKMRASFYLRLGMKTEARREIRTALDYHFIGKLVLYWCLTFAPMILVQKVFHAYSVQKQRL